jgi:hypothetical protein
MTKETRTLVELSDILGVEMECPKCKAKLLIPMDAHMLRFGPQCFQCGADWFGASMDATGGLVSTAVEQIKRLISNINQLASKDRSDIHAPIRLHIGGLEEQQLAFSLRPAFQVRARTAFLPPCQLARHR